MIDYFQYDSMKYTLKKKKNHFIVSFFLFPFVMEKMQNDNLVLHSCELILCWEYTKNRASDSILMLFFIRCAKEIGETCVLQNH